MFRLCRRESGAPLGISAFGCFSTQCYRAHDDVHQLQTDSSVWCSCLQICLWLPAKQSQGFRDLWCSVLHEFSATHHHITGAALSDEISCCAASHTWEHLRVCLCEFLRKHVVEHSEMLQLLYVCLYCVYLCMYVCPMYLSIFLHICLYVHPSNKSEKTSKK